MKKHLLDLIICPCCLPGEYPFIADIGRELTRDAKAQFVLSDPFSWSTEAAPVEEWLGGKGDGPFAGKGLANVTALLADDRGGLAPAWRLDESGSVWWKIRTHGNHFELIRSCYVHASR